MADVLACYSKSALIGIKLLHKFLMGRIEQSKWSTHLSTEFKGEHPKNSIQTE